LTEEIKDKDNSVDYTTHRLRHQLYGRLYLMRSDSSGWTSLELKVSLAIERSRMHYERGATDARVRQKQTFCNPALSLSRQFSKRNIYIATNRKIMPAVWRNTLSGACVRKDENVGGNRGVTLGLDFGRPLGKSRRWRASNTLWLSLACIVWHEFDTDDTDNIKDEDETLPRVFMRQTTLNERLKLTFRATQSLDLYAPKP